MQNRDKPLRGTSRADDITDGNAKWWNLKQETVTSTTHTVSSYGLVLVDDDTAGGAVTVNLMAAASATLTVYTIKKLGSTANITLTPATGELIDGAATKTLAVQYESITIATNGSDWYII